MSLLTRTIIKEEPIKLEICMTYPKHVLYHLNLKDIPLPSDVEIRGDFGIVIGRKGFIITDDEMIHSVHFFDATIDFNVFPIDIGDQHSLTHCGTFTIKLIELGNFIGDTVSIPEWVHYFGVKDRIARNYRIFRASCKEIEADINLPQFEGRVL